MDENRKLEQTVSKSVYNDTVAQYRWLLERAIYAVIAMAILVLVCIVLLFVNNHMNQERWLKYLSEYDFSTVETTIDSEGEGIANYTGGNGGVNTYGESHSQKYNQNEADRFKGDNEESPNTQKEVIDPA